MGSSSHQQQTSNSYNQAYPTINSAFSPILNNVTKGTDALSALLGTGGNTAGQSAAFKNFQGSTGYQQQLQTGLNAVQGAASGRGVFNSGATAKGLQTYGQNMANSSMQSYIQNLLGLSSSGLSAGGVLTGAGQVSNGQSSGSSKSISPLPISFGG